MCFRVPIALPAQHSRRRRNLPARAARACRVSSASRGDRRWLSTDAATLAAAAQSELSRAAAVRADARPDRLGRGLCGSGSQCGRAGLSAACALLRCVAAECARHDGIATTSSPCRQRASLLAVQLARDRRVRYAGRAAACAARDTRTQTTLCGPLAGHDRVAGAARAAAAVQCAHS